MSTISSSLITPLKFSFKNSLFLNFLPANLGMLPVPNDPIALLYLCAICKGDFIFSTNQVFISSINLASASLALEVDVDKTFLACPNAKNNNGQTPQQVACTFYQASKDSLKVIQVFLERWSVLMTILMLRELHVFHLGNIDLAMMDLFEYIGQEKDFVHALYQGI
jgi:hypothetical protein